MVEAGEFSAKTRKTPVSQRNVEALTVLPAQKEPRAMLREAVCGGWGIRTPEGLHPTRFPSERTRPLCESSCGFPRVSAVTLR